MNTAIILILGIPLIEIYLFIKVGSQIGALNTILLILTTAIIGIWYARYEGFNTLRSGMSQLVKNEVPLYEMVSGKKPSDKFLEYAHGAGFILLISLFLNSI